MGRSGSLSASLEDYLEAIHQVRGKDGRARAKDVSAHLQVAASSVTNALRGLVERGLITHEPYEDICLTAQGERLAGEVVQRHEALTDFFTKVLAVDEGEAAECACRMEHAISDVVLERLVAFIKYEQRCTGGRTSWVEGLGFVCQEVGEAGNLCRACDEQGFCTHVGTKGSDDE